MKVHTHIVRILHIHAFREKKKPSTNPHFERAYGLTLHEKTNFPKIAFRNTFGRNHDSKSKLKHFKTIQKIYSLGQCKCVYLYIMTCEETQQN